MTQFGIVVKVRTWSTWRTTRPNATFSTTNPAWNGLRLNLGLCRKRLESNQLSDGMDVDHSAINLMDVYSNVFSQYCNVLPVITLP